MDQDQIKLVKTMKRLESDYKSGKISKDKYEYFYGKYNQKLRSMEAIRNTQAIRNRRPPENHPNNHKSSIKNRLENEKLVEKYIVEPKKNAGEKIVNPSSNKSLYSILIVCILIIGFSVGIGFGVFNLGFNDVAAENAAAIVEDSAFLKVENTKGNVTSTSTSNQNTVYTEPVNNNPSPSPSPSPAPTPEPEPTPEPTTTG